jgi:hypothetical protein
MVPLAHKVQ